VNPTLQTVRTGTVAAYMTSGDADDVRAVRAQVGRVTVSGKSGLRTLQALARDGDLSHVDLDPAGYKDDQPPQDELFPIDWVATQRDLGLDVIRSEGKFARRNDPTSLRQAFSGRLPAGVARVISLADYWLKPGNVGPVIEAVRNCDDPLSFVLAACYNPLESVASVHSMRSLMEAAELTQRRVELLRTDTHAVGFALLGGTQAAIGLSSSGRHHPQPMNRKAREGYEQRQRSASVWIPALMNWQPGVKLDAVRPYGGAGLTECSCTPCEGQDLFRFAREWGSVPRAVSADARAHDVASWRSLRDEVLGAADPGVAWKSACAAADKVEAHLASTYKVNNLKAPTSLRAWVD
jgi:hypothetical protein